MVGFLDDTIRGEGTDLEIGLERETSNGAGALNDVSEDNDFNKYKLHLGREVKLIADGRTELGVLHSYDDLYFYLMPSVINEITCSEENKTINNCHIEIERPQNIRRFNCDITPVTEGYMQRYVDSVNKIKMDDSKKTK